uniref:PedM n=1 Tax=symbiont bacterium of Paederus fuscipes TaxID=176282 RepID=Q5I690_UNCXX|nr:PedM [symbiont bacterium of Paederus fuscipes]
MYSDRNTTGFPVDVQISGMGVVSSIGHDLTTFTVSLAEGRSGIRQLDNRCSTGMGATNIIAGIADFNFSYALEVCTSIPPTLKRAALRIARRAPFAIQTCVLSALEAWTTALLHDAHLLPESIGLVMAGHNTTQNYQYQLHEAFQQAPYHLSPRYALQFMDSYLLGVLSEIFKIRGEGFVCGGASASGNVGIIHGLRMIQAGIVDACLVCGVTADLSPMELQGFNAIGALGGKHFHDRADLACRPFDTQHEGFIYGQASACLLLESTTSAKCRGTVGMARLLSGAIRLHASSSSEPNLEGEVQTMRTALQRSSLEPGNIDYVNTHGSSSPLGDKIEMQAIEQVFGEHFPNIWLNSSKGLIGHCLYSAGVVEVIASVVQMRQGFIHPSLNLDTPINNRAKFSGPIAVRHPIHTAMSNSFGFGGINTSVVLGSIPQPKNSPKQDR